MAAAGEVDLRLLGFQEHELRQSEAEDWETRYTRKQQQQQQPAAPEAETGGLFGGLFWALDLPGQLLGCSAQGPRKTRQEPNPPTAAAAAGKREDYYDAASVDWATVICPTSSAEQRISKFEANVVFAYLRLTDRALDLPPGERHIQCQSNGKIHTLDFSDNVSVPVKELHESLAGLTNLVCLRLHNENLAGRIPLTLLALKLSQLEVLDLSENALEGTLDETAPLSLLTKLEVLNLGHNKLSGAVPDSLGDLVSLNALILNDNLFCSVPSTLSKLTRLSYVDLKNNPQLLPGVSRETAKTTVQALLHKTTVELFI